MSFDLWQATTIGEQLFLQRGFDITKAEQREGTIPVISSSGVKSFHCASKVSGPGVVLGRKGVVGSVFYVHEDYWPHDTTLYVKDFKGNNPRFVYYFFQWLSPQLSNMDVGSANPTLNRNHVHPIAIHWPSVKEQESIGNTLSCLDDKIELNRRVNTTLEEMAQAIFKSWFVDFDPFQEGEFEESELGPIPKGWGTKALGEFCSLEKGLSYKGAYLADSGVPMVNLGCVNLGGGFRQEKLKYYSGEYKPRHIVGPGDLIIANTDMTAERAILGSPIIVPKLSNGDIVFTHHLFVFRNLILPASYLYYYLRSNDFRERAESYANGTTVLALPSEAVERMQMIVPDAETLRLYTGIVGEILEQKELNDYQTQCLSSIRDTLLPKLMSGEIRVPEAEKLLEEVL